MGIINSCIVLVLVGALAISGNNCMYTEAKVFMEYIGATGIDVYLDDLPVRDGLDFYFLLSFAVDANTDGEYQNGIFRPFWVSTLTPQAVQDVKSRHPNVRVMASLAGWNIHTNQGETKPLCGTTPKDPATWIPNAFDPLSNIIDQYGLDGIDVDYENFPRHNNFAYCIGELIKRLKQEGKIKTATIAPYYKTVNPYIELFAGYGSFIDYVNHQFYTDKARNPKRYLEDFGMRVAQFNGSKLLPSYEVDGRGFRAKPFTALNLIQNSGNFTVNGVMIFSADASAKPGNKNPYYYEKRSQDILLSMGS